MSALSLNTYSQVFNYSYNMINDKSGEKLGTIFNSNYKRQPVTSMDNIMIHNKREKRYRSAFTTEQLAILEKEFKKEAYVNNVRREQISSKLGLTERTVKIWFQNRRMKEKRDIIRSPEKKETECEKISDIDCEISDNCDQSPNALNTTCEAVLTALDAKQERLCENIAKEDNTSEQQLKNIDVFTSTLRSTHSNSVKPTHVKEKENILKEKEFCRKSNNDNSTFNRVVHTTPIDSTSRRNCDRDVVDPVVHSLQSKQPIPAEIVKYYPAVTSAPYGFIPVLAASYPINSPYIVTNRKNDENILESKYNDSDKCECNCHKDNLYNRDGIRLFLQSNYPIIYAQYLANFAGIHTDSNTSSKKS